LVQQPKENTPQYTIMEPSTVYGISKQSGERWCEYTIFGVDVRSIRYPGLISYSSSLAVELRIML
jgi:nucleoside-diphosphate-sugar epimerase